MKLSFARSLKEMRPVLKDPNASGPDPVYEVYTNLNNSWVNQTIIHYGLYGQEYPKTFGHHHSVSHPEIYQVFSGEGILLLGSDEEFKLIKATTGDRLAIPPQYSHAWVNTGKTDLVLLDDWTTPHVASEYQPIAEKHGLAYYLVEENGQPKTVPNPRYQNHPEPQWLTAEEFKRYSAKLRHPNLPADRTKEVF